MAVLISVSARPARALRPMRPKAPAIALGAGTNSGSIHPARATPSQAATSNRRLMPCRSRACVRVVIAGRRPALLGPPLSAALDEAGHPVGADDEHEGDADERHVVGRAEQAIGVIDEG